MVRSVDNAPGSIDLSVVSAAQLETSLAKELLRIKQAEQVLYIKSV